MTQRLSPAVSMASFGSFSSFSRVLVAALLVALTASHTASAQDPSLRIEPVSTALDECEGSATIALEISLDGVDVEAGLSGYQLFLRYDAEQVVPVAFEPAAYFSSVFGTDGDSLASGFAACPTWSDGQETDVVALAATIYPIDDGGEVGAVPQETNLALGTLSFEPAEGALRPIDAAFSLNTESCRELFEDVTMIFDASGSALAFTSPDIPSVSVVGASGVENLVCVFDGDEAVDLTWDLPAGVSYERIRILREGELIKTVQGDVVEYRDEAAGTLELTEIDYTLSPVLVGGADGCDAGCVALGDPPDVPFLRGDVDADGRRTTTDSILVLQYLFRDAGDPPVEITCEDAADFDDDGRIVLTDPIFGLDFLFRRGAPIPEPLVEPGLDPTDDDLSCRSYGA